MDVDDDIDVVGAWTRIKLEIIREYASAYSSILSGEKARQHRLSHVYIDAFAGAGMHRDKATGALIDGSPRIAVATEPAFHEFHFVDLRGDRAEGLRAEFAGRDNVFVYHGDCNEVLAREVLPRARYESYRRGLCLIDPYGMHLDWSMLAQAGAMKSIDVFLNFPIMDMNRNALRVGATDNGMRRMTRFWGDESWRSIAIKEEPTLFGPEEVKAASNEQIVEAFCDRLRATAGFQEVPKPLPLRNSIGRTVYYLVFASQKKAGGRIAAHLFNRYR